MASQGSNSFILILDSKDARQISRNFLCILFSKTMCAGILRGTGLQMFGAAMSFIANVLIALPLSLSLMFATSLRVTGKCSSSQKTQFLSHRKSIILKKNAFIDKRTCILISVLLNRVSRDTYTYVDLLNLNRIRSSIIKSISIMKLFWTLSDNPPPFLDSI